MGCPGALLTVTLADRSVPVCVRASSEHVRKHALLRPGSSPAPPHPPAPAPHALAITLRSVNSWLTLGSSGKTPTCPQAGGAGGGARARRARTGRRAPTLHPSSSTGRSCPILRFPSGESAPLSSASEKSTRAFPPMPAYAELAPPVPPPSSSYACERSRTRHGRAADASRRRAASHACCTRIIRSFAAAAPSSSPTKLQPSGQPRVTAHSRRGLSLGGRLRLPPPSPPPSPPPLFPPSLSPPFRSRPCPSLLSALLAPVGVQLHHQLAVPPLHLRRVRPRAHPQRLQRLRPAVAAREEPLVHVRVVRVDWLVRVLHLLTEREG